MDRGKKLAKNIVIFAIGSFSSKLLQFLLIPFYTRILSNSEYGTIDILQNIATLLIPIVSLTIYEAVFRYAMEEKSDKQEVLSIGILVSFVNIVIMMIISFVAYQMTHYEYIMILVIYVSINIVRSVLSQFTRSIGKVTIYTADNILNVFITIISNIILLTVFHKGISGYILGYAIGNFFSIIFLLTIGKIYQYIKFKKINTNILKKMLFYSIPLIPNSICWWVISFSDRWMITSTFGTAVNGIYAISNKVPAVITVLVEVFYQAWQISANKEFESKDISKFYTDTFHYLFSFVFIASSIIMSGCKIITKILIGPEFEEAWYYMPILLLGTSFYAMAQYLGSIYTANKDTRMAFVTNATAAILNIAMNIILLKLIGPIGAAIATATCYLILWIYRTNNTKKIIIIEYNNKMIALTVILAIINVIIITTQIKLWYIYSVIIVIIIIILNFEYVNTLGKMIIKLIKEKIQKLTTKNIV